MEANIKKKMNIGEFRELMLPENLDFTLIRPHEMRQRFTEFVLANRHELVNSNDTSMMSRTVKNDDSLFLEQRLGDK